MLYFPSYQLFYREEQIELSTCMNLLIFSRKISQYVPSELAKVYEKAVHRQTGPAFNPKIFIDFILEDKDVGRTLSDDEKNQLIDRYLEVIFLYFVKLSENSKKEIIFSSNK